MKQTIHILLAALMVLFSTASCDKDGDLITTGGALPVVLGGSGNVVIDKDNAGSLALTLHWTDNSRLTTNDERVQAPRGTVVNTLQFSGNENFENALEVLTEPSSTSMQFTAAELNTLAGRCGLPSDVASNLYIRMRSVLANNVPACYSNVYVIEVTPYSIDMTTAFVLDAGRNDTGVTLASPDADGIYCGFMGVSGWYNWWLQEGNGVLWGNLGVDGKPFIIDSAESHWNFWFPGPTGCYYTVVNTVKQEWSALHIESLRVSGDIEGDMTYDRKTGSWTLTYRAAQAGNATISIAGVGKQYNAQTGTDDNAAISTPVAMGMENGAVTFGATAAPFTVSVPAAGEVTLTLNLSDPKAWTCQVTEGGSPVAPVSPILYVLGNDDTWNYDQYLTLYDEDNLCYAAAVNFNCSWGYYFSREFEDWIHINQDPSTTEWKLAVGDDSNNITAPGRGLYVTIASLGWMSYWYGMDEPITQVSYTGFNDDWTVTDMAPVAGKTGVYSATVKATGSTPWGVQILLNGSWDHWFGTCAGGTLRWSKKDDGNPTGWTAGKSYTFTVDLCKCTYTLTEIN